MACDHNCESCKLKGSCNEIKKLVPHESNIHHVIGVMSGKGGVGKSTVTSMLASQMAKKGYKVGILDADITGPSIPTAFGIKPGLEGTKTIMEPAVSKNGIKVVSVNLILDDPTKPVVWRGPILANAVSQFFDSVHWSELDYLFVDMPPGTSDIALTVFQTLPIDGVVMVTTPQDLVSMVVEKSLNFANLTHVKTIGLIENMSYVKCPCCGEKIELFGKSHLEEVCMKYHLVPLGHLPIDSAVAKSMDEGKIEEIESDLYDVAIGQILSI